MYGFFYLHDLLQPEQMLVKLLCLTFGLMIIGLGTAIYLHANFAPIPVDRLMLIIQDLTRMNTLYSKTFIYLFFLVLAITFSGPIGIGTLLTVCLGGPILNYFTLLIGSSYKKTVHPQIDIKIKTILYRMVFNLNIKSLCTNGSLDFHKSQIKIDMIKQITLVSVAMITPTWVALRISTNKKAKPFIIRNVIKGFFFITQRVLFHEEAGEGLESHQDKQKHHIYLTLQKVHSFHIVHVPVCIQPQSPDVQFYLGIGADFHQ